MTVDSLLKIEQSDASGKTIILLDAQNVDFRNAETLKAAIQTVLADGHKQMVLNLEKVTFMDSSGLGVLLFCKKTTEQAGGSFALCGLQKYVNNLVLLTNLHKTIPVFASSQEALA